MELNDIMETKGVAGYSMQSNIITQHLLEDVAPNMYYCFNKMFETMDWFKAENVHRFRPGAPIKAEKYLLKYFKRQAIDFISKIEEYEQAYEERIVFTPLPTISLDRIPEEIVRKMMEYSSPIVRLENLRKKYTNEFLLSSLHKKSMIELTNIYEKYEDTISSNFEMRCFKHSKNLDMYGLVDIGNSILDVSDYLEDNPHKLTQATSIVRLYLAVEDHLMGTLIKPSVYDGYCELVIKMLHLLVIVCSHPQKCPADKKGCHHARVMKTVPVSSGFL